MTSLPAATVSIDLDDLWAYRRSFGVEHGDAQPHGQIGPSRWDYEGDDPGRDDGEIGDRVISSRQEGRPRQAAGRSRLYKGVQLGQ